MYIRKFTSKNQHIADFNPSLFISKMHKKFILLYDDIILLDIDKFRTIKLCRKKVYIAV